MLLIVSALSLLEVGSFVLLDSNRGVHQVSSRSNEEWRGEDSPLVSRRSVCIFSSKPPRQARRNLKKRKGRERKNPSDSFVVVGDKASLYSSSVRTLDDPLLEEEIEVRPLVRSRSKEAGTDYWMDPKDMERARLETIERANRANILSESRMPKRKLITEIVAPYKQNWIGMISVMFIVLATIIDQFPEELNYPQIKLPDLAAPGAPIPLQVRLISSASPNVDESTPTSSTTITTIPTTTGK